MKVLQITRQFFPSIGGIEKVVLGLSEELAKTFGKTDVLTLRYLFNTKEIVPYYSEIGQVRIFRTKHLGIRRYPIAFGITKYLSKYDILHVHAVDFFIDFISLTQFLHKKPIVLTTHGGIFHTKWLSTLKKVYFHSITKLSLTAVDAVVCISRQDYDLFREIVSEEKLFTIPNGINIEPFLEINKSVQKGLLLGIGRVVENKSIEKLIQVLSFLVQQYPETELVWIGHDQDGLVDKLLFYADQLGIKSKVKFVGNVSDSKVFELLAKASFFVSSASYESFGVSTIEAMSSSTVPIVSPVGVHPEIIQHGESGFICDFDDLQETINCFVQAFTLSTEELTKIGFRAREKTKPYSWNRVTSSYVELYEHILSKN